MLCADHGPCVSGAHNSILTDRAGRPYFQLSIWIPQEMILRRGNGKVLKKNKLEKMELITKYTWRKMKKQDPKVDGS